MTKSLSPRASSLVFLRWPSTFVSRPQSVVSPASYRERALMLLLQARKRLCSSRSIRDLERRVRCGSIRWSSYGLRILFCGSDEFSVVSLNRLHEEYMTNSSTIQSIDVVCKQGKPAGRGLKQIRDVPIKSFAEALAIPLHEIPTFTGWSPPSPVDMIIAVSFGLKVPPRLLGAASYGGLNLHPSLLPDLRGPAPLHHALLEGRKTSGITLQTLHPEHFDQGLIVAQRSFDLPDNGDCTFEELRDHSAPLAADLLIESLQSADFARPFLREQGPSDGSHLTHARKLVPEDSHVDWDSWGTERILRTQRALGGTWSRHTAPRRQKSLRVQWHDLTRVPKDSIDQSSPQSRNLLPGKPLVLEEGSGLVQRAATRSGGVVVIPSSDGQLLSPETVTVEGRKRHEDAVSGIRYILRE